MHRHRSYASLRKVVVFTLFAVLAALGMLRPAAAADITDTAAGPGRDWQGSLPCGPNAVVSTRNGNVTTTIPLTGWTARGGLSVNLALAHNSRGACYPHTNAPVRWRDTLSPIIVTTSLDDGLGTLPSQTIFWGDGTQEGFTSFNPSPGATNVLAYSTIGLAVTTKEKITYEFECSNTIQYGSNPGDIVKYYRLVSIRDMHGNTISKTYTSSGYTVTDPTGRTISYDATANTYLDSLGRHWTVVDTASGRTVTFPPVTENGVQKTYSVSLTYDSAGRIGTYTDMRGKSWSYTYGPTTPASQRGSYQSDDLRTATDPLQHRTTYAYDWSQAASGRWVTTVTDANGHSISHVYTNAPLGSGIGEANLTTVNDAANVPETFEYDSDHNVSAQTDRNGKRWTYTYSSGTDPNTNRNLLTVTTPETPSHTVTNTYNAFSQVLTVTNPIPGNAARKTVTNEYDHGGPLVKGELTRATDARAHATTRTYNAFGQVLTATDALTHATQYGYDPTDGNLVTVTDPNATVATYGYDEAEMMPWKPAGSHGLGWKTSETVGSSTDGSYKRTTYTLDEWGRVTEVWVGNSAASRGTRVQARDYDPAGNVLLAYDGNNHATASTYDELGRVKTVTNGRGDTVTSYYDGWLPDGTQQPGMLGFLSAVTDGNGHASTYAYNVRGLKERATYADGTSESWTYDKVGNIEGYTDQNGVSVHFEYDDCNRLVGKLRVTGPDPVTWPALATFTYDEAGRRTGMTDNQDMSSRATAWTYYDNDLPYTLTSPNGALTYAYDDANRRTDVTAAGLGTWHSAYDAGSRLTSLTNPYAETTSFGYNKANLLTAQTHANNLRTTYRYDALHRVSDIFFGQETACSGGGGAAPSQSEGGLDPLFTDPSLDPQTAGAAGAAAAGSGGAPPPPPGPPPAPGPWSGTLHYEYDNAGNMTVRNECKPWMGQFSSLFEYDGANQLTREYVYGTSATDTAYTYDHNGNRLTKTTNGTTESYTYYANTDALWHIDRGGTRLKTYTYDFNGNCRTVEVPGVGTTTLTYDLEDRVKTIAYPSGKTNGFLYNGLGLRVSKTDNSGPNGNPKTYNELTDGADVASPLLYDETTVYTPGISERPVNGATSYYLLDALGSVVATVNGSQQLSSDQRFDAFGNKGWYIPFSSTFGFAAKAQYQTDGESGLLLLGHRYYDPSVGRFISQDPAQDESNWYAYCGNNPLVATDPTGLKIAVQPSRLDPDFAENVMNAINDAIKKGTDKNGKKDSVATMLQDMKDDPNHRYYFYRRDQDPQFGHTEKIGDGQKGFIKIYIPGSDKKIPIGSKDAGNLQTIDAPFAIMLIHEAGHANGKTGGFGYADPGGVPDRLGVPGAKATPADNVGAIENVARADYGLPLRPYY